jgi:hypothetical protein
MQHHQRSNCTHLAIAPPTPENKCKKIDIKDKEIQIHTGACIHNSH